MITKFHALSSLFRIFREKDKRFTYPGRTDLDIVDFHRIGSLSRRIEGSYKN